MHYFTSINNNYLPKARILAKSVKKHCKNSIFTLVLCDKIPDTFDLQKEPFDEILTVDQLGLPVENLNLWIFFHSVVELCTAVKGQAFYKFLSGGSEKVIYLDPDIVVFNDLKQLETIMDDHDIVLTPHLAHPEVDEQAIEDNEICSMQHGIYNFGFLSVRNSKNGLSFSQWWRDRLMKYCYDDIPHGLFTDQRWGDLAPALFDGVYILRDPSYNIATWNINFRNVEKKGSGYLVNGIPMKFYHFSGFDSGAQQLMLDKYAANNEALWELRNWYIEEQLKEGGNEFRKIPSIYSTYLNGEVIELNHRILIRNRLDLLDFFKNANPFDVNSERSYYNWVKDEEKRLQETDNKRIAELERTINEIYSSRSWKMIKFLRKIMGR